MKPSEEPEPRPAWALANGLPSLHVVRAALHAAAVIDMQGSVVADADESHWHHATGGAYPPDDLARGRRLLLDLGLLVQLSGSLRRSRLLDELLAAPMDDAVAAIAEVALARRIEVDLAALPTEDGLAEAELVALVPDASRREAMLVALGRRFDDAQRRNVGEIGEELVVAAARGELRALGHHDLARAVRRVSLVSDQLGYDIRAPRIERPPRLLEVKATTTVANDVFSCFVSRNEIETGLKYRDWALVACLVEDLVARTGCVLGWCTGRDLEGLLPSDGNSGRWESALVCLPITRLVDGLPSPA